MRIAHGRANFTRPLLFLADSGYYAEQAQAQHLQG
jgi:hypothetical protein